MLLTILRSSVIVAVLVGISFPAASAQNSNAPGYFTLEVYENFITMSTADWISSGAFADEGVIAEVFKHEPNGNPLHAPNLSVIYTLSGSGGTFTWKFTRHFSPIPGNIEGPTFRTGGAWQMIGGTGAYSGITGEGVFEGTVNLETGEVHDIFTGHASLSP